MDNISVATITLEGIAPMFHSKQHAEPKLAGESHADYEVRTWPHKTNSIQREEIEEVYIPSSAIHQALFSAAKYSKKQIPGQGKSTWRAKFEAGLMVIDHGYLGIDRSSLKPAVLSVTSDGVRGSGKRVTKYFPTIPKGWKTTVDVWVLDPIIVQPVFDEMVYLAGLFIGFGAFRPQNGGSNGRFKRVETKWQDNRDFLV